MIYECWWSDEECRLTVIPEDHVQKEMLTKDSQHLYCIRADSWEEAMTAHNEIQGWAPYVPMREDNDE